MTTGVTITQIISTMTQSDINITEKKVRAAVIREYMERNGIACAVCFSCGNASRELRMAGVNVLDISPSGDMEARRWFTQEEIRRLFPAAFDATSGHLPMDVMLRISARLRAKLEGQYVAGRTYTIPSGSGETVLCLAMAFPECSFVAEFDDADPARRKEQDAPLIPLIRAKFERTE